MARLAVIRQGPLRIGSWSDFSEEKSRAFCPLGTIGLRFYLGWEDLLLQNSGYLPRHTVLSKLYFVNASQNRYTNAPLFFHMEVSVDVVIG